MAYATLDLVRRSIAAAASKSYNYVLKRKKPRWQPRLMRPQLALPRGNDPDGPLWKGKLYRECCSRVELFPL